VIGPTHRPLPSNTQHSQDSDIHAPGGNRTRNPNKREAANVQKLDIFSLSYCVCVFVCDLETQQ